MNIHVPSTPGHLQITQGMLEDLLYDPVLGAWLFFRIKLDAFQRVRLKWYWFCADVEDHSGKGSGKTIVDWIFFQLSCVLIPDTHCYVFYPTFQQGKDIFWQYYNKLSTPLFRAQLGKFDMEGEESGKANSKEPSSWKQHFKNGGMLAMPAPNFLNEAESQAGIRFNRALFEEWTKIVRKESGMTGLKKQLMGRADRECFNKHHPVWGNKVIKSATAELSTHEAFPMHQTAEKEMLGGNPDYATFGFSYKDYSGLRNGRGKTFREAHRDDKRIRAQEKGLNEDQKKAEMHGVWAKKTAGWITDAMISMARSVGSERGLVPIVSRSEDLRVLGMGAG